MTIQIYHLDDDVQILERMERILSKNMMGHPIKTHGFESLTEFEKSLSGKPHVDIFILDAHLGDSPLKSDPLIADGPRIAATCRERYPESLIFICSSATDIKTIRASLQMGANDFIAKESKPDEILSRIESALRERSQNGRPLADDHREHVGSTLAAISLRAPNLINSAVNCIYIEGESGTGKEVAAATFERALPAGTPFVKVIAAPSRRHLSRASCLATRKARLPARQQTKPDSSRQVTRVGFFWMRSRRCLPRRKSLFCALSIIRPCAAWDQLSSARSLSGLFQQRTSPLKSLLNRVNSVKTSGRDFGRLRSIFHRCVSDGMRSRNS